MTLDPRPSLVFFLQMKKAERGLGTRLCPSSPIVASCMSSATIGMGEFPFSRTTAALV